MNAAIASQSKPLPEASKQIDTQEQLALQLLQQGDFQALLTHLNRLERVAEKEADEVMVALLRTVREACLLRQAQADTVRERRAAFETAVTQAQSLDAQMKALLTRIAHLLPASTIPFEKEKRLPSLLKSIGGWLRPVSRPEVSAVSPEVTPQASSAPVVQTAVSVSPPPAGHTLAVYMLGPFRVYADEKLVMGWVGNKSRSIFKYLLAQHPAAVNRDVLMDTFWPSETADVARRNLYQVIYLIRQALQTAVSDFPILLSEDGCYRLNPDLHVWIDCVSFEQFRQAGMQALTSERPVDAQRNFELASELYGGDFLAEDLYEDWPLIRREQVKQQHIEILDQLSDLHFAAQRFAACNAVCRQILQLDGCREDTHRRLMRSYAALGQRHLALRQYHRCLATLAEELNVPPEEATEKVYRQLMGQA